MSGLLHVLTYFAPEFSILTSAVVRKRNLEISRFWHSCHQTTQFQNLASRLVVCACYLLRLPIERIPYGNRPVFVSFFFSQKFGSSRTWVISVNSLCFCNSCIFPVSEVGALLMGDTADIAVYSSINILFKLCLNPFHSRICKQNTCFNMYNAISMRQQCSPCKNSHPKCFTKTNFDRSHCRLVLTLTHIVKTHFIAELICIVKHLNGNKVLRAKILTHSIG